MNRVGLGVAACALLLVASVASHAETVDAIWKTQRVAFYFGSSITSYSCGGLTQRIATILRRVGAENDLEVVASACDGPAGLARIEVTFRSPVPATRENLQSATRYDATQLLAARVRGETLPAAEDLVRFNAEWQTISFARDRKLRLAPGDCDLVSQMLDNVLSRMAIRVESERLWCSSLGSSHRPRLTVAALVKSAAQPAQ